MARSTSRPATTRIVELLTKLSAIEEKAPQEFAALLLIVNAMYSKLIE